MAEARMNLLLLSVVLLAALVSGEDPEASEKDFVQLYEVGVRSYLDEFWQDCIDNMQKSNEAFKQYRKSVVQCRLKCRREAESAQSLSNGVSIEDLGFYEKQIRATLCLLKCGKEHKIGVYSKKDLEKFERLAPYDYLQLCYFQKNMLTKAADAAFTFLVENPAHESMKKNFDYYLNLPEVDRNDITNLEAQKYVSLYIHGVDAYNNEDFESVIQYFEESLSDFLQADKECRAFCEGPFDQGWHPDFIPSLANHFTFCLKCKTNCSYNMNTLNGERHNDLLPSHYHFLQIAYFKVGKLKEACEAATSYMLFYPTDKDMLENIEYYKKEAQPEFFQARKEAVKYVERYGYEKKILDFIDKEFTAAKDNKKGDEGKIETNEIEDEDQSS